MNCDLLIKGGQVFDGSGAASEFLDVAIHNERIVDIGKNLNVRATRTLDARGLVVCPGFIDIKTHSDFTLPINPKAVETHEGHGDSFWSIGLCFKGIKISITSLSEFKDMTEEQDTSGVYRKSF